MPQHKIDFAFGNILVVVVVVVTYRKKVNALRVLKISKKDLTPSYMVYERINENGKDIVEHRDTTARISSSTAKIRCTFRYFINRWSNGGDAL